jgi:hypothetical protein
MEFFEKIASWFIFFGSGVYFLIAVEQITKRIRHKSNYILFVAFFLNAFILLDIGLIANRLLFEYPASTFFFLTSIYLLGPISLAMFYSYLYPDGDGQLNLRCLPWSF